MIKILDLDALAKMPADQQLVLAVNVNGEKLGFSVLEVADFVRAKLGASPAPTSSKPAGKRATAKRQANSSEGGGEISASDSLDSQEEQVAEESSIPEEAVNAAH